MALHVRLQLQFPQVKVLILGICVALLGLASIVMGIVAFTKRVWGHYVATGLWGGTVVFAAGTCAIIASQLRTPCSVKSYFVCSVFGILTSFIMIVLSAGGLDYDSKFYNFAYFAYKKRHSSTILVHATTLMLAFLSFLGNIVSLIVCLKYIVYDRHRTVCETKVKRPSARPLHKNAARSNSESRVPLTGCHRSSRHHSRCKKNGTNSREMSRGERRSSDGSRHSQRHHRRKHEQPAPSRGSRSRNCHAPRSAIEYENITNDNILRQHSEYSEVCTDNVQVDLLPTAFDEDELPPYEPAYESHSFESVGVLPPNIPPNSFHQWQGGHAEGSWNGNVKPPVTPPGLDPDVRARYLANHELADNLDSVQRRKPSAGKCSKIVPKNMEGTRSEDVRVVCSSAVSNSFSDSVSHGNSQYPTTIPLMSHPLDTPLSTPVRQLSNRTVIPEKHYENINKLSREPATSGENSTVGNHIHSPSETNISSSFEYPSFHLRLEPEGRQDGEEKEDVIIKSLSEDNNIDANINLLPSPTVNLPTTSVASFQVSEDIEFADSENSTKDLNLSPLKPINIGSPTSAFRPYDGRNSLTSPNDKPFVFSGLSDSFGGARPKYTTNTLPLTLDQINPKPSSNFHRQSSWKDFLLPSSHNTNRTLASSETPSTIKNDIVPNGVSPNSTKGEMSKFVEPQVKTMTQPRPTPPVFIPPSSLKLKKTTLSGPFTSSNGSTRPITSLHPRYHQPFPSDLSMLSQPYSSASTGVACTNQSPLLSDKDSVPPNNRQQHISVSQNSVSQNSIQAEPNIPVPERPSLVGGEHSDAQVQQQQRPDQQEEEQQGQRQLPQQAAPQQEGPRQPPLFSLLL